MAKNKAGITKDITTTLRYLHVTNRDMLQVMSPLDDLKMA